MTSPNVDGVLRKFFAFSFDDTPGKMDVHTYMVKVLSSSVGIPSPTYAFFFSSAESVLQTTDGST